MLEGPLFYGATFVIGFVLTAVYRFRPVPSLEQELLVSDLQSDRASDVRHALEVLTVLDFPADQATCKKRYSHLIKHLGGFLRKLLKQAQDDTADRSNTALGHDALLAIMRLCCGFPQAARRCLSTAELIQLCEACLPRLAWIAEEEAWGACPAPPARHLHAQALAALPGLLADRGGFDLRSLELADAFIRRILVVPSPGRCTTAALVTVLGLSTSELLLLGVTMAKTNALGAPNTRWLDVVPTVCGWRLPWLLQECYAARVPVWAS